MSRTKASKPQPQRDPRHEHQPESHEHPVARGRRTAAPQRRVGMPEGADRRRMSYGYRTTPRSAG